MDLLVQACWSGTSQTKGPKVKFLKITGAHTYNPLYREAETGGPDVRGHALLCGEFAGLILSLSRAEVKSFF